MGDAEQGGGGVPMVAAHVLLGAVAGHCCLYKISVTSFVHPAMHIKCLLHGAIGCLYHGGSTDLAEVYKISVMATRYLLLPCVMADMYRGFFPWKAEIKKAFHWLSGFVPFIMAASGQDIKEFGIVCIAINILAVAYYTLFQKESENSTKKKDEIIVNRNDTKWGWCLVGASIVAYLVAPVSTMILYPIGLAGMEYCSHKDFKFNVRDCGCP